MCLFSHPPSQRRHQRSESVSEEWSGRGGVGSNLTTYFTPRESIPYLPSRDLPYSPYPFMVSRCPTAVPSLFALLPPFFFFLSFLLPFHPHFLGGMTALSPLATPVGTMSPEVTRKQRRHTASASGVARSYPARKNNPVGTPGLSGIFLDFYGNQEAFVYSDF